MCNFVQYYNCCQILASQKDDNLIFKRLVDKGADIEAK